MTKDSLVQLAKIARKKKAWSFQNDGKHPALNDTSSESYKLEHYCVNTQQKILKSITSYIQSMDCRETAFSNHNRVW